MKGWESSNDTVIVFFIWAYWRDRRAAMIIVFFMLAYWWDGRAAMIIVFFMWANWRDGRAAMIIVFFMWANSHGRESSTDNCLTMLWEESDRPILILCFLTGGLASSETETVVTMNHLVFGSEFLLLLFSSWPLILP